MHNTSAVSDEVTARTCWECAEQRAENLHVLGSKKVLELCVGPSLSLLERAYEKYGIEVTGNDVDRRWRNYYPRGRWVIGDALAMDYAGFDAVVFAPPLTNGCTGKREDALSVLTVQPRYLDFVRRLGGYRGVAVLVLPGRSGATSYDREEFFELLARLPVAFEVIPLKAGKRKIVKYYDVYLECSRCWR
jgi:hypothetical protein